MVRHLHGALLQVLCDGRALVMVLSPCMRPVRLCATWSVTSMAPCCRSCAMAVPLAVVARASPSWRSVLSLTSTGCRERAVFCTIALEPLCSPLSITAPHVRMPASPPSPRTVNRTFTVGLGVQRMTKLNEVKPHTFAAYN
jgi:hypothetical protein